MGHFVDVRGSRLWYCEKIVIMKKKVPKKISYFNSVVIYHQTNIWEGRYERTLFLKNKRALCKSLILNYPKAITYSVMYICTYLMKIFLNNVFTHMI